MQLLKLAKILVIFVIKVKINDFWMAYKVCLVAFFACNFYKSYAKGFIPRKSKS